MAEESLSASEALSYLLSRHCHGGGETPSCAWIDVRSEGEFVEGSVPGFRNLPILSNTERHEIGIRYKQAGQASAIELGYELTAAHQESRTRGWVEMIRGSGADLGVVACWRGGLRSQIAARWIREAARVDGGRPIEVRIVEGGYKALRRQLLLTLAQPWDVWVLSGPTGSGKTSFLHESGSRHIDLEGLARHRGSAFGGYGDLAQPSQVTFENGVALHLLSFADGGPILIEDESARIGSVHVPNAFFRMLKSAPLVVLEEPLEARIRNIHREYVCQPLEQGVPLEELRSRLIRNTERIRRSLGGLGTDEVIGMIEIACRASDGANEDLHGRWIARLLTDYYDRLYAYTFERCPRKVLFRGDRKECQEWISSNRFPLSRRQ